MMSTVAVIPIKMNNVRTPGKNTKPFDDGTPLIHCIQKTILEVKNVDEIYVYCSNKEIIEFILPGIKYVERDTKFDTPEADVIEMMRVFSQIIDADIYIQVHATAPFLTPETIFTAANKLQSTKHDSVFTVKKLQDFLWKNNKPFNYSLQNIPRTQDMLPFWVETTGLYAYKKEVIQNLRRRIGDDPYLLAVSEIEAVDINTPCDFEIANAIYSQMIRKK